MQADVRGLMAGELGSWLQDQTKMRDEAREKAYNRWFFGWIALLPVLSFLWFAPDFLGDFKFYIGAAGVMGIAGWGYKPIKEAKKAVKIGINTAIARDLSINYSHDVKPGEEYEAASDYGLVPSCDRSNFEDRWYGRLQGHDFNLFEAHLEERRGSGRNRRWVTVFRGAIIEMGFGRSFHSTTLLQRKGTNKKWFGLGGQADVAEFHGHRLSIVDHVHPDFGRIFEVYSDDQVEARVLMHPSYVEHLLEIERVFGGRAVRALFRKGKVVLAVESDNMFESGSMKAEEDAARVAEAAEQFGALARLATALNQNERGRTRRLSAPDPAPIISEYARETTPRQSVGFGRKGL
jgi:hypothetical protein